MNKAGGFITLHRQILDWEWYRQPLTAFLFIHLILSANFADTRYKGKLVKRGQLLTSLPALATATGMSIRQTRTALSHLVSTGEIADESTPNYRIITVIKYDDFQSMTDKMTDDRQTIDRQLDRRTTDTMTDDRQHNNNNNNINKGTNKQGNNDSEGTGTARRFVPPSMREIQDFCLENGLTIDVDRFVNYYQSNGWMVGRNRMKDWRSTVRNWARKDQPKSSSYSPQPVRQVTAQQYEQRNYDDVQKQIEDERAREIEEKLMKKYGRI